MPPIWSSHVPISQRSSSLEVFSFASDLHRSSCHNCSWVSSGPLPCSTLGCLLIVLPAARPPKVGAWQLLDPISVLPPPGLGRARAGQLFGWLDQKRRFGYHRVGRALCLSANERHFGQSKRQKASRKKNVLPPPSVCWRHRVLPLAKSRPRISTARLSLHPGVVPRQS